MRRLSEFGIVFIVLVVGTLASSAMASIVPTLWTTGVNAQQDEDAEIVMAPVVNGSGYTYQELSPSSNLAAGDILVGGINYYQTNGVNYGGSVDNFNVLFMSQIASTPTSSGTAGLVNITFAAPSVANWDAVVTALGLPSIADKSGSGSVAVLYSNPYNPYSYATSHGTSVAQNFNYIYGNGATGGSSGTTILGELGFKGSVTGSGSSQVTLAAAGEGWVAVGPPNLSGAQTTNVGTSLPGSNITIAIDPTNGYLTTLGFVPQVTAFGGPGADFSASETLAGVLGANTSLQVTSGGNASFVLVPEPTGIVVVGGLFGLWGLACMMVRRKRKA